MSLWQRLLRALGYPRMARMSLQVDQQLVASLRDIAENEQRLAGEVAADLLSYAVAHRHAADESLERWRRLSPREQEVAALVRLSYTNRQIASLLVISPETVKTHIRNILRKWGLRSKVELRQALADWDFQAWHDSLF
jgi:DNA-binding NarL/FixJ family response regulator